MQYLLDTHTFLWFVSGDVKLSERARLCIENPDHEKFISLATFWEIAIKINIEKLTLDVSFQDLYQEADSNGFKLLPITIQHIEKILYLEPHHRDPFDRILISQAIIDNLVIIGKDTTFSNYSVKQLW